MRVKYSAVARWSLRLLAVAVPIMACASSEESKPATGGNDAGTTRDSGSTVTVDPTGAPGGACVSDDTCQSKLCASGKCTAPSATDNRKNGKETDIDCGGTEAGTPRCASGKVCISDGDCTLKTCIKGVCADPTSTDGKRNSTETDVDCGGPNAATPRCHAGAKCGALTDCESNVCVGKVCMKGNAFDEVRNDDETDVDCGGTRAPTCVESKVCKVSTDCFSGICLAATKKCAAVHPNDGIKNGTETDIDCGGPEAPPCAANLACLQASDCDSRFCTANKCEARQTGRKDGDETDVDCGGKVAPKCTADFACLADADCSSGACSTTSKKCLEGPSCRRLLGGETCGPGEIGAGANHESCCRTLKVPGYSDAAQPGKTVYLDKYEITAGRLRTFIEAISAANAGSPNLKAYMAANRPSRWNVGWEKVLAESNTGAVESYTITNPTTDLLYPGPDKNAGIVAGPYFINTGLYYALTASHFFPEYPTEYSVTHALNCSNANNAYGFGTYYFEDQVVQTYGGGVGKYFSQNELDVKSANCTPFAVFAAFCAWDGGQLATDGVMNFVTAGNRLLVNGAVPACSNGINSVSDSSQRCDGVSMPLVYSYPATNGVTYTGASRIAAPGRVAADVLRINANDEPWFDLKGNLLEVVLKSNDTFGNVGYGLGYSSVRGGAHPVQSSTPRHKGGSFGARCMRFK